MTKIYSRKKAINSSHGERRIIETTAQLNFTDIVGSWKARWGLNRMNYRVTPGLYRLGAPDHNSPVMVTANYKMSFDSLRKELKGLDVYILVLDSKGVNVWCAASKGSFATSELVNRIRSVGLSDVVDHKNLIVPQLSATGISAHEVKRLIGYNVIYGPIRAADIPAFLKSGMKATPEMRRVRFKLIDRLVLIPIEIVGAMKVSLTILGVMFLLNLLGISNFNGIDVIAYMGSIIAGGFLTPILLPLIPARAFSIKGWFVGLVWVIALLIYLNGHSNSGFNSLEALSYILVFPSVASFIAMNFTGSSTYTSLSGVAKEMKVAVPFIIATIALGLIVMILSDIGLLARM